MTGKPSSYPYCPQGHEFTPENTYKSPSGNTGRLCRECRRTRNRERYHNDPEFQERRKAYMLDWYHSLQGLAFARRMKQMAVVKIKRRIQRRRDAEMV